MTLQRYEEALAACDQALHWDPQDAHAWIGKGATLYMLQRYEEALAAGSKRFPWTRRTSTPGRREETHSALSNDTRRRW